MFFGNDIVFKLGQMEKAPLPMLIRFGLFDKSMLSIEVHSLNESDPIDAKSFRFCQLTLSREEHF